ncbi:DUF1801 domain-containing protein [Microbacterium sp.]|uniref:DUF1801 domain-containing protein n=1 Tax=Microbacterium sp. TaxID=51671 RepID=UPI0033423CC2
MTTIDQYTASLPEPFRAVAAALRGAIDEALPDADSRIYHSHPVWLIGGAPAAGFKAYARYVTFMIWNGAPIDDPSGELQSGARMSTVKYAELSGLDTGRIVDWLRQSVAEASR